MKAVCFPQVCGFFISSWWKGKVGQSLESVSLQNDLGKRREKQIKWEKLSAFLITCKYMFFHIYTLGKSHHIPKCVPSDLIQVTYLSTKLL